MNKRIFAIFIFVWSFFMFSVDVYAADGLHQTSGSTACGKKNQEKWNNKCKATYGIKIKATDYNRKTAYLGNGQYQNEVGNRTITVEVPKNIKYQVRIFIADSGTLDDIKVENVEKSKDDDYEDVKVIRKTISDGEYKKDLPAGKDALVFVLLKDDTKLGEKCTTKSNTKEDVICENGFAKDNNGKAILNGVAASMLVENPKDVNLIDNIRKAGSPLSTACTNARKGINSKGEQIVKMGSNDSTWSNYYLKFLGDYCEATSVPFLLFEKQVSEVSDILLELYSSKINFQKAIENGDIKGIQEINDDIVAIKNDGKIVKEFSENDNLSIDDLSCKADAIDRDSSEYLYTTTKGSQSVTINGQDIKVCDVKCYEHLTVQYDPPVASIAGLCFTYKVTVKSETKCGVADHSDEAINKLSTANNNMCAPVAICSEDANSAQGGPSEEFDDCIKQCDNGKYSQNCINKCYKDVYGSESTNTKKTSNNAEKISISKMINNTSDYNAVKINFSATEIRKKAIDEDFLKKYYKEDHLQACNTSSLKNYVNNNNDDKLTACAEYFFNAKSIYPYGKYNNSGTKWNYCGNNNLSITSDYCDGVTITTDGNEKSNDASNIPMQIARSSPFNVRDISSTKQLIKDLLGKNNISRKYVIDENGIKRQNNNSYSCNASCKYTGCQENTDKLDAKSYTITRKSNIKKIADALAECSASAVCDKTEKTSSFDIKIDNPRKANTDNEVIKEGTTELDKTAPTSENITCPDEGESEENADPDDKFSMFVPANDDKNSKYGILGYCYDKNSAYPTLNPQYKTTITFPGSWINYKARKIEYNKKDCNSGWELKGGYFCSAYDSEDVNEEWWKWRMQMKDKAGNIIYSTVQEPENNNNIRATANNFGKYNWNITYSCFYGIHSEPPIPGDDDDDDGGTRLQDHKFQVFKAGDLFTEDSNQKQGYNWTSDATVTAGVNVNDARALTYTINPQKYINYINKYEKDEKIYDSEEDYYIYLSSDGMKYIKNYRGEDKKQLSYTDYNGEFKEDPNINGLVRYTSSLLIKLNGYGNKDIYIEKANGIEKINNNYNDLNSLLGID